MTSRACHAASLRILGLALLALPTSTVFASDSKLLTRSQAIAIARKVAAEQQWDVKHYEVDNFVSHLSDDGKTWIFHFLLAPSGPPDTGFFAEVDRKTGTTKIRSDF